MKNTDWIKPGVKVIIRDDLNEGMVGFVVTEPDFPGNHRCCGKTATVEHRDHFGPGEHYRHGYYVHKLHPAD